MVDLVDEMYALTEHTFPEITFKRGELISRYNNIELENFFSVHAQYEDFYRHCESIFLNLDYNQFNVQLNKTIRSVCSGGEVPTDGNGWIPVSTPASALEVRFTKTPSEHFLCYGGYTGIKNLDSKPMRVKLFKNIEEIYNSRDRLDVNDSEIITLRENDYLIFDGASKAIHYLDEDILFSRISTVPLKPYGIVIGVETGEVVVRFNTDVSVSKKEVLMRLFAAGGFLSGRTMALEAMTSDYKELRWAALNFLWRLDTGDLLGCLDRLVLDPDRELRALAQNLQKMIA